MNTTFLSVFCAIILLSIGISILCIKQKYKDQKACFFVDLFTVTAAGASLAISLTILYQTTSISNVTNVFQRHTQRVGMPIQLEAQIKLSCVNLGDGQGLECQWQPEEITTTN